MVVGQEETVRQGFGILHNTSSVSLYTLPIDKILKLWYTTVVKSRGGHEDVR